MFITPFAQKVVSAVVAGCFIAAGILTFGDALIFDRLFIVVMAAIALYVRNDINVLGIIVILTTEQVIEETVWLTMQSFDYVKWVIYGACLTWLMVERKEPCFLYFATMLVLCSSAEMFWFITDSAPPIIYWHLFQIVSALLVRKFLILRSFITAEFFPKKAEPIRLDHYIYNAYVFFIWINMAMIIEYLLRYVLGFNGLLYMYNSFDYFTHFVTIIILYNLTDQSIKETNRKVFEF